MKLTLQRIEEPFVMELTNEQSNSCLMDAIPSLGGQNKGFRPMQLLAGSLAGCISVDVLNVLRKQRIDLKHYKIEINAHRKEEVPSPFEYIHMIFEFDTAWQTQKRETYLGPQPLPIYDQLLGLDK